ncbi:MAG: 5'-nucleotidase C-terminal domain-containing protein [Nocardioidaceae bacterium]
MSASGLRRRTPVAAVAAFAVVLALGISAAPSSAAPKPNTGFTTDLQVLSVSDFHGQLDPLSGVGGAAALSAYWAADRAAQPNTLLVTGGDTVGASPPLSSFFEDRPTIEWMNYTGFTADTFGNHNFDAGLGRLQSQIDLASFDYVSSNLRNVEDNLTGVSPYKIYKVDNLKVAIIGVTNPEAPELVKPGNLGTIEITDPAAAAMAAQAQARAEGAKVLVAVGHLGITGTDSTGAQTGPLVDFANAVRGFDVILGDHTDVQYSKVINNALVVENKSKGATYAKTSIRYDRRNGGSVQKSVRFVIPTASAVTPDPNVVALLAPYRTELAKAFDGKIGVATGFYPRGSNVERNQEVAIGNLTADALRAKYGTQIAFTNSGGLRSPMPSSYLPQDTTLRRLAAPYVVGPPYDLVIGDVFAVLPFGNQSLTRTVTGAQLWSVLEHSVGSVPGTNGKFLQISGFKFSFDSRLPLGAKVLSVALADGTPILRDGTVYTAATNDFTNAGGDGFTMLVDGQGVTRDLLANDLLDYIVAKGTITPVVEGRITRLG